MKILVLGYGLLGKELVKQTGWDFISRKNTPKFNINNLDSYKKYISSYKTVINCIANTDTYSLKREEHWKVNYKAVSELVELCNDNNQKLVHISTDYVYSGSVNNASIYDVPVHNQTWYGYSKLLGDAHVQLMSKNFLIIRCGHKKTPFIYKNAFGNVVGNFDYVDKIASLIIKKINNNCNGIQNIGTDLKSMFDLANKTNKDVKKTNCKNNLMPNNISMKINK